MRCESLYWGSSMLGYNLPYACENTKMNNNDVGASLHSYTASARQNGVKWH